jgi:hypothetical protein
MDAADIMYNMAEAYANCASYQDRGIVRHFEQAKDGGQGPETGLEVHRHRVAFKTFFRRADQAYYFEWAEPPVGDPETASYRVNAFWTAGDRVLRLFHSQPGAEVCPSLEYVIAASAGISKGASVTIAAYMLPSLKQKMRTLFRLRELVITGECDIDGRRCRALKGQTWSDSEEELWIDADDFLLRRTRVAFVIKPGVDEAQLEAIKRFDPKQAEEYRKFRMSQTEERRFWNQIEYHHAAVGAPISDDEFEFDPQAQSDLIPSFAVL